MAALYRRRVRYVPQLELTECGVACLAMVLGFHGRELSLEALRNACGVGRDGMSAARMAAAARAEGLEVSALRLEPEALDELACPAILHWEFNHFVVLEGCDAKGARIVDPASGPRRVSLAELARSFTGVALGFVPTANFVRTRSTRRSWARLAALFSAEPRGFLALLACALLLELLGLVAPALTQVVIDQVLLPGRVRWLWPCLSVGALALLCTLLLLWLRDRLLRRLHCALDMALMERFVDHLLRLPLRFFAQRAAGDLLQRVEAQRAVRELALRATTALLDGLLVLGYGALMLAYSPRVGLVIVGLALLRIAFVTLQRRSLSELSAAQLAEHAKELSVVVEALSAPELMRASSHAEQASSQQQKRLERRLSAEARRDATSERASLQTLALDGVFQAALLWLAGQEVLSEHITLGVFAGLVTLQQLFQAPLAASVDALLAFARARTVFARIDDVYDAKALALGSRDLPRARGELTLRAVSYRHDASEKPLFSQLSLTLRPGEYVGLVGSSGQGKSTLLMVLAGLLTPSDGEVLLDGVPLHTLAPAALARHLGVVLQEPFLLEASVRDNLRLGRPDASDDELRWAARCACIDTLIERLPDGYDTLLGGFGRQLSGGERQRLALARALVGRPKVLLLDEPTSSLDLALEAQVAANLRQLGCTCVVIAHRLHTLHGADRIYALEGGLLRPAGTTQPRALRQLLPAPSAALRWNP